MSDTVHRRKDENRKKYMNIYIARERRRDYDERNQRTVFVHFSTCSSACAEKMSAFPAMGIVIVDVATVKDAAKHTAVFVVNLNFSFSLFSFVLKLLLLDDDEADGFVLFFSSSIVRQHLREGCRFSTFRALALLFTRRTAVLVVESVVIFMRSFLFFTLLPSIKSV